MIDVFVNIFNTILYQPLFNALIFLYNYIPGHDFGVAIILFTIIIRIILYPLTLQSIRSQKNFQELQPKIKEIQEKYKKDREKQGKALLELYQKEKINPFSGCLPLLIQIPILIALYQIFWKGFQPEALLNLYSFIPHPGQINPVFLGIIDLSKPFPILAFLVGFAQFFQTKMTVSKTQQKEKSKKIQFSDIIQKQTLYFFPFFMVLILWKLPAALSLYLLVTTLFTIFQQYIINTKPY